MGTGKKEDFLLFALGDERYCTAVREVHEVVRPALYTHLPGASPGVLGVMNVRGKIIPVFDASQSLLGTPKKDPFTGLVLILSSTHGEIGLLVDDVHGLIKYPSNGITPPPNDSHHPQWVIGRIERDGTFLALVDLHQLVDSSAANRSLAPAGAAL